MNSGIKTHVSLGITRVEFTTEALKIGEEEVVPSTLEKLTSNTPLVIAISLTALLTLISIFQFKNLKRQKLLLTINYVFMAIVFFFVYYTHIQLIKTFPEVTDAKFEWSRILLVLLPAFNYLASSHIKKDIELLASVDRLR
jgi:predicted neutral ceramidase superfamily lipid hydrolase